MKTLFALKSCMADKLKGCHDTIRQTWGQDVSDLRFFVGREGSFSSLESDEVSLLCPDDYDSLPFKTKAIAEWTLEHDYSFIFLCDVDTFLIPRLLLQVPYKNYDYSGRFGLYKPGVPFNYRDHRGFYPNCYPWTSGGLGYFLSRKAVTDVANSFPHVWAEDMWVGQVLGPMIPCGDIKAFNIPDFENEISWHYPSKILGWDRKEMQPWLRQMYKDHR